MPTAKLIDRDCKPLPAGTPALTSARINGYLAQVKKWKVVDDELVRDVKFKDYYETMAAVVAVAMLAQREDHHPDMQVGYNKLQIRFSTHSVGGLSDNDFICAAKVNALLA